jgi:hypothetical protein
MRLVPDLLRCRGRSVGGDLNVSEDGSEQTIVALQSLHHDSVTYQHVCTRVGLAKKAKFLQMQSRTQARIRKKATELQINVKLTNLGFYKPSNGETFLNRLI